MRMRTMIIMLFMISLISLSVNAVTSHNMNAQSFGLPKWKVLHSTDKDFFSYFSQPTQMDSQLCLLSKTATKANDLLTKEVTTAVNQFSKGEVVAIQVLPQLVQKRDTDLGKDYYGYCVNAKSIAYIKIGSQSTVYVYEQDQRVEFDFNSNQRLNITLYKNITGDFSNAIGGITTSYNPETYKIGAYDEYNTGLEQYQYVYDSDLPIQYTKGMIWIDNENEKNILNFDDICNKKDSNCTFTITTQKLTVKFNSNNTIDPSIIVTSGSATTNKTLNFNASLNLVTSNITTITPNWTLPLQANVLAYYNFDAAGLQYRTGVIGQALNFNGVNNVLTTGNLSGFFTAVGTSNFSLSFWMKPASNASNMTIFYGATNATTNLNGLRICINCNESGAKDPGHIGAIITDNTGVPVTMSTRTTNGVFDSNNSWYHVVVTSNLQAARLLTIYVNGAATTQTTTQNNLNTFADWFVTATIGASNNALNLTTATAGSYYMGELDEVKMWNRTLSANDVLTIYNNEIIGIRYNEPAYANSTIFEFTFENEAVDKSGIVRRACGWQCDQYHNPQVDIINVTSARTLPFTSSLTYNATVTTLPPNNCVHGWCANFNSAKGSEIRPNPKIVSGAKNFTIMAWVKFGNVPKQTLAENRNISCVYAESSSALGGQLPAIASLCFNETGTLTTTWGTGGTQIISRGQSVMDNTWHHVALTYNGTINNRSMYFYVDGAPVGSITKAYAYQYVADRASIGGVYGVGMYNGSVDELMVIGNFLSDADIQAIYNNQSGIFNPIGYQIAAFQNITSGGIGSSVNQINITRYVVIPAGTQVNISLYYANLWNNTGYTPANDTSLIGWYHLDNDTQDASTYGFNATWGNQTGMGTYNKQTGGLISGGYQFRGQASSSDHVTIPTNTIYDTMENNITGGFSISAWVYWNNLNCNGGGNCVIVGRTYRPSTALNWAIAIQEGTGRFWQSYGGGSATDVTNLATVKKWTHYVINYYPKTSNATYWIDGTYRTVFNKVTLGGGLLNGTGNTIEIGAANRTAVYWWSGANATIDEVMIWNRTLSDSEIKELYFTSNTNYLNGGQGINWTPITNTTTQIPNGAAPNNNTLYKASFTITQNISHILPRFDLISQNGTRTPTLTNDYNIDYGYNPLPVGGIQEITFTNRQSNNGSLITSGTALLNVTITNGNGTAYIEFDNNRFEVQKYNGNVYNFSISIAAPGVYAYNWTGYNQSNNAEYKDILQWYTVKTAAANNCTYPGSGDWNIAAGDQCVLNVITDIGANAFRVYGENGSVTINTTITCRRRVYEPQYHNGNFSVIIKPGARLQVTK